MNGDTTRARKITILQMLDGFPSAANLGSEVIDAMVVATEEFSLEALVIACRRFSTGEIPDRDNVRMPPSSAELVPQVKMIDAGIRVRDGAGRALLPAPAGCRRLPNGEISVPIGVPMPDGFSSSGDLEVDFGDGRIDMREMTRAQRDEVYRLGRKPDRPLLPFTPKLPGMA